MKKFILGVVCTMFIGTGVMNGKTVTTTTVVKNGNRVVEKTVVVEENVRPDHRKAAHFCDCHHCKNQKEAKRCKVGKKGGMCNCKSCKKAMKQGKHHQPVAKPQPPLPKPQPVTWRQNNPNVRR